jgi:hypothetical protein
VTSVAVVSTKAVKPTDMPKASSDLDIEIISNISDEVTSDLEATMHDVEKGLSGSSAFDLTGNLQ